MTIRVNGIRLPRGPLRPRDCVMATRALDTVVLMNKTTEQYLTLHETTARIWELVGDGLKPQAIVDRLCEEYEVPPKQAANDVGALLEAWLEQGLIEAVVGRSVTNCHTADREAPSHHPECDGGVLIPSVFYCGVLLLAVKGMLKILGYTSTIHWIGVRVRSIPLTSPASLDEVKNVEWRVAMAGALYPGRARCLEQSLVLYYILRGQGVPATYQQGVQPHPFQAHAWIEYRGEIINDVEEHVFPFARLPKQLP